jgi:hypothetical protein
MTSIIVFTTRVYGVGETELNADCGMPNAEFQERVGDCRKTIKEQSFYSMRHALCALRLFVKDGRKEV